MLQLLMWLMNNYGNMQGTPAMQAYNQMMSGKTPEQQKQTILNMARSKGFDPDAKIFSEADLRQLGLRL